MSVTSGGTGHVDCRCERPHPRDGENGSRLLRSVETPSFTGAGWGSGRRALGRMLPGADTYSWGLGPSESWLRHMVTTMILAGQEALKDDGPNRLHPAGRESSVASPTHWGRHWGRPWLTPFPATPYPTYGHRIDQNIVRDCALTSLSRCSVMFSKETGNSGGSCSMHGSALRIKRQACGIHCRSICADRFGTT